MRPRGSITPDRAATIAAGATLLAGATVLLAIEPAAALAWTLSTAFMSWRPIR